MCSYLMYLVMQDFLLMSKLYVGLLISLKLIKSVNSMVSF